MGFPSGPSQNQPSVRVTDSAGVDQALLKKLVREIEANKEKVTYCYEQHLKSLTISGRLVVMLGIETSGNVSSVEVTTPRFRNTTLTRCIVRSMKHWQFTPFTGESLKMEVPYLLKAQY
jgi:outer membrane biosynthesis protein TonB